MGYLRVWGLYPYRGFRISTSNTIVSLEEYYYILLRIPNHVPKISLDMPAEIIDDLKVHVGDEKKYISLADAVRTACRRLLDQLDEIDRRHGRLEEE